MDQIHIFYVFWSTKFIFLHFLVHQIYLTVFWSTKFFFCKTFYEFFPALIWDGITIFHYVIKDKTFKNGTIGNESLKPIISTPLSNGSYPLHFPPTQNHKSNQYQLFTNIKVLLLLQLFKQNIS